MLTKLLSLINAINAQINASAMELQLNVAKTLPIPAVEYGEWNPFMLYCRYKNRDNIRNKFSKEINSAIEEVIKEGIDLTSSDLTNKILKLIDEGFIGSNNLLHFKETDFSTKGSSLMTAIRSQNKKAIDQFLANGADLNFKSKSGSTPLHRAVEAGNIEMINYLLAKNVDLNTVNEHGCRPLYDIFIENTQTLIGKSDEKKLEILSLFTKAGVNFNLDSIGGTLFESLLTLTDPEIESYDDPSTKFKAALIVLGSKQDINLTENLIKFFTNKNNINELFSQVGYDKEKVITGCKLYKALMQSNNDVQEVLENILALTKHQFELIKKDLDDIDLKILTSSITKLEIDEISELHGILTDLGLQDFDVDGNICMSETTSILPDLMTGEEMTELSTI
ncbi:hypothetical protein phytr_8910 [Candidatus Phycorickettsia trachydisci]|uniref:Uncharacterized protein n=1 Tax=Candidatus Phycorickettsia trachydisci TaxID=2115978 RepID=A0A2P1P979_9RICK|nr:ankyrin repeat domain-containing protein [Candidatus Phycorickettsia trachydisci]AVP87821.1 hypothetical protein phytr_8910 [Candidatus Phycorickettsia trachydisci]